MKCPTCDLSEHIKEQPRPDTPHYAEYRCVKCDKWISWVKGPDTPRSTAVLKRTKERDGYTCQFCGRPKEKLGERETLTTDHMTELNEGGKDELSNTITLCTACHKLKLWVRTYVHKHLNVFYLGENGRNTRNIKE